MFGGVPMSATLRNAGTESEMSACVSAGTDCGWRSTWWKEYVTFTHKGWYTVTSN